MNAISILLKRRSSRRPLVGVAATLALGAAGLALAAPSTTKTHRVHAGESIQAAIDRGTPGETILVDAGVYHENLTITKDRITLRGAGDTERGTVLEPPVHPHPSVCTEFGEVNGICISGRFEKGTAILGKPLTHATVSGFLVRGFSRMGILVYNARNTTVSGSRASRNHRYGIVGFSLSRIRILNNVADRNGEGGIYIGDSPSARALVSGNSAYRNHGSGGVGIYVRDTSVGAVRNNRVEGNCAGIVLVATHRKPMSGWSVDGNTIRRNTLACLPIEGGPPLSGLGLALLGTDRTLARGNLVSGNQPSERTPIVGGILIASSRAFGGADPTRNLLSDNRVASNRPADVIYDGSGDHNRFVRNHCGISVPNELCR